ncbi:MAG: hypothetical protein WC813_04760 [Patescibacteria group bacterium]|jgi:hypothetical protein
MRLCGLVLGLFLSFATPLFALGATVDPSASDLTVMPGETAVATISVKNDADWSKNYEVSFAQVKFGTTAEEVSFTALSTSLKGALLAAPKLFTLEAHASRTIDVSVQLPVGLEAQSPTIAILVTEKGDQGQTGGVQSSVASMLFLHVPGNLTRSMSLDSFIAVPTFTWGRNTMISGLFRNDGEETIVLPNEIRVFGPFGGEVGRGLFSSEPKHLPPGTTRGVTLTWPASDGFSKFLIGSYRFELWDGDQQLAKTKATFVPITVFVVLGASFIVIFLGIITLVRRRTK